MGKVAIFLVFSMVLTACGSRDVSIHYATQEQIMAQFPPGPGMERNGYAQWDWRSCDIYIVTPEEFAERYPVGFVDIWGESIATWDDLYAHELRHCDEGNFHP